MRRGFKRPSALKRRVFIPDPGGHSLGVRMPAKINSKDTGSPVDISVRGHCLDGQERDLEGQAHPESPQQVGMVKAEPREGISHTHTHMQPY